MKKITTTIFTALFPILLFAWDPSGHMTGGAIAYEYLKKNNPDVLAKIIADLKNHPWFSNRWNAKMAGMSSDEQKDEALFMLASTYPDDIKSIPSLDVKLKRKWHFVDNPYVPANQHVSSEPVPSPNAEEILDSLFTALKAESDAATKAVGLCWVFHLIEDIHQPLHTATMFDDNHPTGDEGGNINFIKVTATSSTSELHGYWDGLIKGTINTIPGKANTLLQEDKYQDINLPELTADPNLDDWIQKESFQFAIKDAYKNGTISGKAKDTPVVLPAGYSAKAKQIAERRIVLAGIRLAKKLVELYS
jgi:hypothetical protein